MSKTRRFFSLFTALSGGILLLLGAFLLLDNRGLYAQDPLVQQQLPTSEAANGSAAYTVTLPVILKNYCGPSWFRLPLEGPDFVTGTAKILQPAYCDGFPAGEEIVISGSVSSLSNGSKLWLFVVPYPGADYFPQSIDPCFGTHVKINDTAWSGIAFLGVEGDPLERFELILVAADGTASDSISNHLKAGCQLGSFTPMAAADLHNLNISELDNILLKSIE